MATSDESIRAYASRPWAEVERLKLRYWAETDMTPAELLRHADELRRYTLSVRSDWPDEAARRADLEVHIRMARQLFETGNARRQ